MAENKEVGRGAQRAWQNTGQGKITSPEGGGTNVKITQKSQVNKGTGNIVRDDGGVEKRGSGRTGVYLKEEQIGFNNESERTKRIRNDSNSFVPQKSEKWRCHLLR